MQRTVTAWLRRQLDSDSERKSGALRFALSITGRAIVVACIVNVVVHWAIDWVGLLPFPLAQTLLVSSAMTVSITSVVTLLFGMVIGQAIREVAMQRDAFEHLSCTDALSGVCNRRAFFERFKEAPEPGQLILVDIDCFKAINDTYGHLAGDEVIRGIGRTLSAVFVGTPAVIGRIGGEEFAVFLPKRVGKWSDAAEVIRTTVAAMIVEGIEQPITISLGVAASEPPRPVIEVYSAADRALYLAKAGGRNRVVCEAAICTLAPFHEASKAGGEPMADPHADAA